MREWASAVLWVCTRRVLVILGLVSTAATFLEWSPKPFRDGGVNWLLGGATFVLLATSVVRRVRCRRLFLTLLRDAYHLKDGRADLSNWTGTFLLERAYTAILIHYSRRRAEAFIARFRPPLHRGETWVPVHECGAAVNHTINWIERHFRT